MSETEKASDFREIRKAINLANAEYERQVSEIRDGRDTAIAIVQETCTHIIQTKDNIQGVCTCLACGKRFRYENISSSVTIL